jgi:hypothetical protein
VSHIADIGLYGSPAVVIYNRIDSTKSPPSSDAGNFVQPKLMSQVGRVREVVSELISVFLQLERWRCQDLSAYVVAVDLDRGI